jgi:hypothetical protein
MKRPFIDLRGLEGQASSETANKRPRFEDPVPLEQQPQAVDQQESAEGAGSLPPVGNLDDLDFSALFNVNEAAQGENAEHQRAFDRLFEGSPEPFVDDGSWLVDNSAQGQEGEQQEEQEQHEQPGAEHRDE